VRLPEHSAHLRVDAVGPAHLVDDVNPAPGDGGRCEERVVERDLRAEFQRRRERLVGRVAGVLRDAHVLRPVSGRGRGDH
jgi:hypothetical protein